jgi:hypothetical protein
MAVKTDANTTRPFRGARAFTDSEEWAIFARVTHGKEKPEALAVECGCTSRTIANVITRRRAAIEKEKPQSVTAERGATTDTEGPASPKHIIAQSSALGGERPAESED